MDQALLALMKQLSAEEKLMFQSDYDDQKKAPFSLLSLIHI